MDTTFSKKPTAIWNHNMKNSNCRCSYGIIIYIKPFNHIAVGRGQLYLFAVLQIYKNFLKKESGKEKPKQKSESRCTKLYYRFPILKESNEAEVIGCGCG